MFVAVYRFVSKEGAEEAFRQHWLKTTEGIYRFYGSLGSRLHATDEPGVFIGYAQWPDRQTWQKEKTAMDAEFEMAREKMRGCLESSETLFELDVTDDYLQSQGYSG